MSASLRGANLTARGGPACGSTQSIVGAKMNLAKARFFLCSQVSMEQMTEGHRSERVVGESEIEKRSFLYFFIHKPLIYIK